MHVARLASVFFTASFATSTADIPAVNIQSLVLCQGRRRASNAAFFRNRLSDSRRREGISTDVGFRGGDKSANRRPLRCGRASFTTSSLIIGRGIDRRTDGSGLNKLNYSMDASEAPATDEAIKLLRSRKQSLRKQIRSRVKSTYPPSEAAKLAEQSDRVFSRLFSLPQYRDAKSVGFFLSMPSGEIQTGAAMRRIVDDGKVVYVPRVGLDFEKCDMDLIRCETTADDAGDGEMFYDSWPRNKWGIPEPPVTATHAARPGDIDLLIVPGLSFDTHGHRLGQGKGYYDRFIAKMRDGDGDGDGESKMESGRGKHQMLLVGVCLEEQFLDEVPHGVDLGVTEDGHGGIIPVSDHDYIMDMVLTPSRALDVSKS